MTENAIQTELPFPTLDDEEVSAQEIFDDIVSHLRERKAAKVKELLWPEGWEAHVELIAALQECDAESKIAASPFSLFALREARWREVAERFGLKYRRESDAGK